MDRYGSRLISVDVGNTLAAVRASIVDTQNHIPEAARIAVNYGATWGRTAALKEMAKQSALPKAYMSRNLTVTEKATNDKLQAEITGRTRATSLARFAVGVPRIGKKLVKVKVKSDRAAVRLPRAFYVRLRSGSALTETKNNMGLAVRLPAGQSLAKGKGKMLKTKRGDNLWLLYGPSVDQIFSTVRDDVTPAIMQKMESEFIRQLGRFGLV